MRQSNRPGAIEYIPGLIEEGYSNSAIVYLLKEYGLSYRLQNMYRDINEIRSGLWGNVKISEMPRNESIPDEYLKTWEGDTSSAYRAVIRYHYVDTQTGRAYQSGATLYSDEPFTRGIVEDWFDIHRQTLESGTGTDPSMKHILSAVSVEYFRNVPPKHE